MLEPRMGCGVNEGRLEALLAKQAVWTTIIAALMALQAALVLIHQPWMDEWQALMIALLSPDLASLLDNLHYEGHPPLWYLLLRGVGAFVSPYWTLQLVQLPIALTMLWLILGRLPLPRIDRLLVACGYFTLVEFGSLSRSLSLGVTLFLLFFCSQQRWLRWAAIILLPMADFQFGLLSIIALILWWREGERSVVGPALWAFSSIVAAISILPAADMVTALPLRSIGFDSAMAIARLSSLLVPFHFWPGVIDWPSTWPPPYSIGLGVVFVFFADHAVRRDLWHRCILHGFLWTCLLFSTFVYPFAVRHMTLIALLLIVLIALQYRAGLKPGALVRPWLALVAVMGLWGAGWSLARPFNSGQQAAAFIREAGLDRDILISAPPAMAVPVAAWLGQEIGSVEKACTQAFHRWDKAEIGLNAPRLGQAYTRFGLEYGAFTLISSLEMSMVAEHAKMRLIRHIPAGFDGYDYYIYSVAYDRPKSGKQLPRCTPERLRIEDWRKTR
jgi:hypothetical protein